MCKKLTIKGLPPDRQAEIENRLNGNSVHRFNIKFETGDPYVVEGILDTCEFTVTTQLPLIGKEITQVVGDDFVVCCSMFGRPDIAWRSPNDRPDPAGW